MLPRAPTGRVVLCAAFIASSAYWASLCLAGETPPATAAPIDVADLIRRQFEIYDPAHAARKAEYSMKLQLHEERLRDLQTQGFGMALSGLGGSKTVRPHRRSGERPLPNRRASLPSGLSYRSDLVREPCGMACSDQIYVEAKSLITYTADWDRVEDKLAELARSLENTDQEFATRQPPEDGSWGACYDEWFMKLDATIDGFYQL